MLTIVSRSLFDGAIFFLSFLSFVVHISFLSEITLGNVARCVVVVVIFELL